MSARGSIVMVDSNVLLDPLTEDPVWYDWSSSALAAAVDDGHVASIRSSTRRSRSGVQRVEELDAALPAETFLRLPLPWPAVLAGKCFLSYRRAGGARRSPLPDFYIEAHAAIDGLTLLTRDTARYCSYLPRLRIIALDGRR